MDGGEGKVIMQTRFGAHYLQEKSHGCAGAAAEWRNSAGAQQKHGKNDGEQDGLERGRGGWGGWQFQVAECPDQDTITFGLLQGALN